MNHQHPNTARLMALAEAMADASPEARLSHRNRLAVELDTALQRAATEIHVVYPGGQRTIQEVAQLAEGAARDKLIAMGWTPPNSAGPAIAAKWRAGLGLPPEPPPVTPEEVDRIADLTVKAMPGGLRAFCHTWGWRQFAYALIDNFRPYGLRRATPPTEQLN